MIRGTTPTHIFTTKISLVDAVALEISYAQGEIILTKTKADCVITPTQIKTELTQEETFAFKSFGYEAEVQITAKFMQVEKHKVLKSKIITIDVSRSLKKEII